MESLQLSLWNVRRHTQTKIFIAMNSSLTGCIAASWQVTVTLTWSVFWVGDFFFLEGVSLKSKWSNTQYHNPNSYLIKKIQTLEVVYLEHVEYWCSPSPVSVSWWGRTTPSCWWPPAGWTPTWRCTYRSGCQHCTCWYFLSINLTCHIIMHWFLELIDKQVRDNIFFYKLGVQSYSFLAKMYIIFVEI